MTVGTDSLLGDVPLEGGSQRWQVQVAVDVHPVAFGEQERRAHVEQKNWTAVRQLVGYLRYDTEAELLLLNKIWQLRGLIATTSTRSRS
jgi:hypothetical protein